MIDAIAGELDDVRTRSLDLLAPLPDPLLVGQHSPLMSPLVWDLGHVANYEEQWLVRALNGGVALRPELDGLYDAFRHPRATRAALTIPGPSEARAYGAAIRSRVLDLLPCLAFDTPLLLDGFVHRMVVQHEHQHDETILASLQLLPPPGYRPRLTPVAHGGQPGGSVALPGGAFTMGTSASSVALDNERPAHIVEIAPFRLDATPVTNGAYAAYLADTGADPPQGWSPDGGGGWVVDRFGWPGELVPDEPVQHVSWNEATAYAQWAGKRLPTEAEWEYAASDGGRSTYPWGSTPPDADRSDLWYSLDATRWGPLPVGSLPAGANSWGVRDLIGGVWEWTSSDFSAYPGFVSFPYREYSEVFFGPDYKVLRGGSWATHPSAMRATFRNWDFPIRRQIFSGFRCATDA